MDWIEQFLTFTSPLPSPESFRLWSGISAVAGALERRVWTNLVPGKPLYSNMYILLVAAPGIGKTVSIEEVREIWNATERPNFGHLYVAPEGLTKAALLDTIAESKRAIMVANGVGLHPEDYCCLNVAAGEFGVLVPAHDNDFLNLLNYIFDNPPTVRDRTRTSKTVNVHKPQLNILAGTQPGYLANLLPEEAWNMGFMSRVLMIYAGSGPQIELFEGQGLNPTLKSELIRGTVKMTELFGQFNWEQDAQHELIRWYGRTRDTRMLPIPEHSKLQHYIERRAINVTKLAMVSAASRGAGDYLITLFDLNRARDWLLAAEQVMPDVFREMVKKSDSSIIQELHQFLWQIWLKDKKPVHESRLIHFVAARAPSEKVLRIIEIAGRSGVISLVGDKLWQPKPRHEHGVE